MDAESFDVIIVGAGAAGCVLAGRLSEVTQKKVLLIEAGADAPAGHEHPDIRDSFPVSLGNPLFAWPNFITEIGADLGNGKPRASRHFVQGRGVGGSSNIQGMFAMRGLPEDYDEWRDGGAAGWGWNDVLPYFKKLEHDLDFSGPLHGTDGPIPIRRIPPAQWAPFSKAVGAAIVRRGYAPIPDYNADFGEGLSSMPLANLPDRRVSASMAYLTPEVRQRPNLTILSDVFVERIDLQDGAVSGVTARTKEGLQRFSAPEAVVASGALQSPALLMRSGIGPGAHLRAMGLDVVRDLPGVGCNLQNHPKVQDVAVHLPRSSVQPAGQRAVGQNCLRYSSHASGCASKDMIIVSVNRASWHPLGRRIGAIAVVIHKPYSKGTVELASPDPAVAPRVQFNVLSDPRDFDRLVSGLRVILEILNDKEVLAARNEAFLPAGKIVASLAKRTPSAWLKAQTIAILFENDRLRQTLLKDLTLDVSALAKNDAALADVVRRRVELSRHVCGTCRMGSAGDPEVVVDQSGRVRGVGGLRIADASVFPTITRGNTHIPVLMVAEKMADHVKADWGRVTTMATSKLRVEIS